jgi:hypothetical protein
MSIALIALSTWFIPSWNEEPNEERVAFWNYGALLFTFYTLDFFTIRNKFIEWDEKELKRNIIVKFCILGFVVILGKVLSKYIASEAAFLVTMVCTKLMVDLVAFQKHTAENQ